MTSAFGGGFGEPEGDEPLLLCDRVDGVGVYGVLVVKYADSSGSESDSPPYKLY